MQKAAETASSFLDQKDYSWPPPVSSLPALTGDKLMPSRLVSMSVHSRGWSQVSQVLSATNSQHMQVQMHTRNNAACSPHGNVSSPSAINPSLTWPD